MTGSSSTTDCLLKEGFSTPRRRRCKSCGTVEKLEPCALARLVHHLYLSRGREEGGVDVVEGVRVVDADEEYYCKYQT